MTLPGKLAQNAFPSLGPGLRGPLALAAFQAALRVLSDCEWHDWRWAIGEMTGPASQKTAANVLRGMRSKRLVTQRRAGFDEVLPAFYPLTGVVTEVRLLPVSEMTADAAELHAFYLGLIDSFKGMRRYGVTS